MHELTVIDALMAELDKARAEAATLRAELEGLRADAERWQTHLKLARQKHAPHIIKQLVDVVDAAIDAAKADKEG